MKTLVMGGYGSVGGKIVMNLIGEPNIELYLAGRSLKKAKQFQETLNGCVKVFNFEGASPQELRKIEDFQLIINCVEDLVSDLVDYCAHKGIHYIDITANNELIVSSERYENLESTIVQGAGLSPGLTNLLSAGHLMEFDLPMETRHHLLFSLGDRHGKDALRWLLKELTRVYATRRGKMKPLSDSYAAYIPAVSRIVEFYNFNYADQHIIEKQFGGVVASTGMNFKEKWIIPLLKLSGYVFDISPVSNHRTIQSLADLLSRLHIGNSEVSINVKSYGIQDGVRCSKEVNYVFDSEAQITADVACHVVTQIISGESKNGVQLVSDVIDAELFESNRIR